MKKTNSGPSSDSIASSLSDVALELIDAVGRNEAGANAALAAEVLRWLGARQPDLSDGDRQIVDATVKLMAKDGLRESLGAVKRQPASEVEADHFPEIERRGIIAQLDLRFYVSRALGAPDVFTIGGDVRDVETGEVATWAHQRHREPGETDDDALRAAILDFLAHETSHGLYRDGKPLWDPHQGEDPRSS